MGRMPLRDGRPDGRDDLCRPWLRRPAPYAGASHPGGSHVVIPIKSRGIVLGVIFLYPEKSFNLKPSDIQMFDTIGAQLGMAVENLRLYAEVKESSEKYWDLFEKSATSSSPWTGRAGSWW